MYDEKRNFIQYDIENDIRNGQIIILFIQVLIVFAFVFATFELPTYLLNIGQGIFESVSEPSKISNLDA